MNYRQRQQKLRRLLEEKQLHALVITHLPNLAYLCGFTGSAGVLVASESRWVLITDGRYAVQAREQVQGARVVIAKGSSLKTVSAALSQIVPLQRQRVAIGIEADHMTVATRTAFAAVLPKTARLRETRDLVEHLRMIKEPEEVGRIRTAVLTGSALLDTALEAIKPGVSETQVAAELEYAARRAGCEAMSFPTIVASGVRSALPHGTASRAAIPRSGFVVLDFGVILAGYCSDMTRTVCVGRPSVEMRGIYDAVRRAQQAAIDAVRPGIEAGKVDDAARKELRHARLARFFSHSTGHGVGLEIHEPPRVAHGTAEALQPGMVITIEPGAYVPGKGGVRIEDMVVVTERGCEVLTPSPKDLITL
jgi:Xaa-Pro aminopeptidase